MSDDIRRQSDTLRDNDPSASSDATTGSSASSMLDSAKDKVNEMTSGSSSSSGGVLDEINRNVSNERTHANDTVPMTGLDDTSVDKVLDSSDLSGNRTLTEVEGSGKQAAFGVMDALAGRGKDVEYGKPLPGKEDIRK